MHEVVEYAIRSNIHNKIESLPEVSYHNNFKDNKKYPSPKLFKSFIEKRGIQPAMSISDHNKELKIKGKGKLSKKIRKSLKQISRDKAEKSLLFALSRSVKKNGIKPKPFVKDIMTDELKTELKVGMAKIFGEEIVATFRQAD